MELYLPIVNTIVGILALYLLLVSDKKVWFWSGAFIGLLWFWWISMSFRHYGFPWAMPIGVIGIALVYAVIFWFFAWFAQKVETRTMLSALWIKALFLLLASYIHPFGFDWFKPELLFVESYLGVEKWQFALILLALCFSILKSRTLYLSIILLAYEPTQSIEASRDNSQVELVTTNISIDEKWNPDNLTQQIDLVMQRIDNALVDEKKLIVFPESVLPIFLNKELALLETLREKSERLAIVIGALNLDETIPRNSTFIFYRGEMIVANKVILVPFGENNPLPDWLGDLVNDIFYDGAVDYEASSVITDYKIDDTIYRNAICYEACSEALYRGEPKEMIVISNNGWFTPSIQATQQRLLLEYYSRKYGTKIYHSVNKSASYIIEKGRVKESSLAPTK